ncbi:MAG: phosphoenolpyruvate carboxykinase (GTP), partial [Limisphaerales bacterium]
MTKELLGTCNISNKSVLAWVQEMANLCRPDSIFWCNGSKAERKELTDEAVAREILIRLNPKKLPGCYYHRSNPNDVARVEQSTYI